ncbi:MAG: allantoicase [Myxococcota bacterium]|nr:allantoicase [Myxococcota bacterium]
MAAFTGLTNLLDKTLGAKVVSVSDDFFAESENLIEPSEAIFDPDRFTEKGKWMDGWESRRRRVPGHDWCVLKLAQAGCIRGFDIDTSHFLGNHPPFASIEACRVDSDEELVTATWTEITPQTALLAGSHNYVGTIFSGPWTHIRLNIFPDGGVARLRAYGEMVTHDSLNQNPEPLDLAALKNGGRALACSDMFFGKAEHLIHPGDAKNMGGGWESRRRRDSGHDWAILQLAARSTLETIEVDTKHFKGNFPDHCTLEGIDWSGAQPVDLINTQQWIELAAELPLQMDANQVVPVTKTEQCFTHLRIRIFPCGGVSRLRVYGKLASETESPGSALTEYLNQLSPEQAAEALLKCCGSTEWARRMTAARPFAHEQALFARANEYWWSLTVNDWKEAYSHHPAIGADKEALRKKFAKTETWSTEEQSGVNNASEETLSALASGNQEYLDKFGYVFLVCATGKSADEMLSLLRKRLPNDADNEIRKAAAEQAKITEIRLHKLKETL